MAAPKSKALLTRASEAKRESKYVDFKGRFDPDVEGEWIELIKDFVAMANTGGGVVVVGVANDGSASGEPVEPVLDLDGAKIADKLARYVGENFDDFDVQEASRAGTKVAAIVIGPAIDAPLVFTKPGKYTDEQGKDKTAFVKGAVYFRHSSKSEPATSADLRAFIERRLEVVRKTWLEGVKTVVTAPHDAEIVAIQRSQERAGQGTRIRITTDEDAQVYGRIDPDVTHPYRQKELIEQVNQRLPGAKTINSRDILSIRRAHGIDEGTNPDFAHLPKFGGLQYSDAFVDWIVGEHRTDNAFFDKARARLYQLQHGGS